MDFCKASHWSRLFQDFAIRMYMAFIDTLRSQNTDLQTFKYFMHIIPTKVDPDNLKGCQICNDHINYNLHNIMVCHLSQRGTY